jgi:hypothetical protein
LIKHRNSTNLCNKEGDSREIKFKKEKNLKKPLLIVFFVVMGSSCIFAAGTPDTPGNRQAAAERYLAVVSVENMMKDIAEKTSENLPNEQREIYVDIMTNYIRISVLERAVISSLVSHFTVREMDALTDFYESPEGRSAMKKFGAYMADVMPVIEQEIARAIDQYKDAY